MRIKTKFNEGWLFTKENQTFETLDSAKFNSISVPHTWNNLDGQDGGNDYYRGTCWYKKDFELTSEDLEKELYLEFYKSGIQAKQIEGNNNSTWILIDYNDVIVHLFDKEDRLFYDLERIWKDGKVMEL